MVVTKEILDISSVLKVSPTIFLDSTRRRSPDAYYLLPIESVRENAKHCTNAHAKKAEGEAYIHSEINETRAKTIQIATDG